MAARKSKGLTLMEKMIRLETERLILRDYTADDLEQYCRLKMDAKTMHYLQDI